MSTIREALSLIAGEAGRTAAPHLQLAASHYDIRNPVELATWLAHMHVESGGFKRTRESLNYTVSALLGLFGRHRISKEDAERYGRLEEVRGVRKVVVRPADQEAIANCLYGGAWGAKNLGNTQPGDGWRFAGKGFKQLTGRANVAAYSLAQYNDDRVLLMPTMLEQPVDAAMSAAWFWFTNDCGPVSRTGDDVALTRIINGGSNGLDQRIELTKRYRAAFRV